MTARRYALRRDSRAPLLLTRIEHAPASAPQIAAETGWRRDGVWRTLRYLEHQGCVRRAGTVRAAGQRGSAAVVWEVVP